MMALSSRTNLNSRSGGWSERRVVRTDVFGTFFCLRCYETALHVGHNDMSDMGVENIKKERCRA